MKRLIKNYTTDIPVERTVAEIQKILSENGASAIAIEYLTNPLIFIGSGLGTIRPVFVDASAEGGLERGHDEGGSAVWAF